MVNLRRLITRSFFHYFRGNILAACGIAVATAVITGALIIGDSLSHSLERAVHLRLGQVTHTVTAGDRVFTGRLAERMASLGGMTVSQALVADGMAVAGGGSARLNRVQVLGVDESFGNVLGTGHGTFRTDPGEAVISENTARRLQLETGDFFTLRMKSTGIIPMNTPLVSDAGQSVTRRVRVSAIAGDDEMGRFNLRVSQTPPYNVFVDIGWLNTVMELEDMANIILINAGGDDPDIRIQSALKSAIEPEDANLALRWLPERERYGISSGRVFIEEHVSSALHELVPGSDRFLTYFVNSLEKGSKSTPYSFVTAGSHIDPGPGNIIINRWLADDLDAGAGDSLVLSYFETGPRRELTERTARFIVSGILEMDEAVADSALMPFLPGLSDAGNCRDWDAGVPVALDRIRDADELYWQNYRGTPKAFISLEDGLQMWTNRFGNLTAFWLPPEITGQEEARELVKSVIDPAKLGFRVNELRERGLQAASQSVDFGMLFGGLGFFVMLSGVMIFFLLILYNIEQRGKQARLFSSLGYSDGLVRKIYLGEGMLVTVTGSVAGILAGIAYARFVHFALSGIWQDIVHTDMLEMIVTPTSLVLGFAIGIAVAIPVIIFSLKKYLPVGRTMEAASPNRQNAGKIRIRAAAAILTGISGIAVTGSRLVTGMDADPMTFFSGGALLLFSFLLFADILLLRLETTGSGKMGTALLILKNLSRNRTRSLSVIILLALGIFVVVAAGSHRKDASSGETHHGGGTGGFSFVAEATVPVLYDLNGRDARLDLNIPPDISFVQFMASYGDDASCLNLNEVVNPRILAVNPSQLSGRFSFSSATAWLKGNDPWETLEKELPHASLSGQSTEDTPASMRVIPAIADQAVIQWGMGKKVGDTLVYTDERGNELGLLLVGGLANSVFQGNVIISESNFLRHFPSTSGSTFFLIEDPVPDEDTASELDFIFRDHGWEMLTATDRLNDFNSVENTYLAIFLILGALGVLMGVGGLAVVMARSITERENEIALYAALGFQKQRIISIISAEYIALLFGGLAAGLPPALIAALPSLTAGSSGFRPLIIIIALIMMNGILWILTVSGLMLRKRTTSGILRND